MLTINELRPPKDVRLDIASRLKAVRLSYNMTQEELSRRSGVPLATLRRFEREGEISMKWFVNLMLALRRGKDLDALCHIEPQIDLYAKEPPVRYRASKKHHRQRL